jgi:hypothetical protein
MKYRRLEVPKAGFPVHDAKQSNVGATAEQEAAPAMFGIRFGSLQFVTIFASSRTEVDVRPPVAVP